MELKIKDLSPVLLISCTKTKNTYLDLDFSIHGCSTPVTDMYLSPIAASL